MRRVLLIAIVASWSASCAPVYWLGMKLYYVKVPMPAERVEMNIGYDASAPTDHKRQLDLYLPEGRDWPTVVFVHGGGWAWGDRSQKFGGADVYGNIGRFLASKGYGAAVISYRLIWQTDWRTQAGDVARAITWVQRHIAERGGNPQKVFVMGHSAGAQLAMRVAVDPQWLEATGGKARGVCGVIAVSGAGYDMEDRVTEELGGDRHYFVQRFGGSVREVRDKPETYAWRRHASVLPLLDSSDPPALMLMAEQDHASLHRQNRLTDERLRGLGLSRGFVIVAGVNHERMVLELSRADHVAGPAILKFLRETSCPR
jgi:acetyl esterase/lipase